MADQANNGQKVNKEFKLSSASVNNRKTVFLITLIILIGGIGAYTSMPKENFPELKIPEIYVGTAFPGGSPEYIEDKITQPFEKEIQSVKNIDKITSTTINGYSSIRVQFDFSVTPEKGKRKIEDAISQARSKADFPALPVEPNVFEMDFGDIPVMNVNLSGDFSTDQLKEYAEILKDSIEQLVEVSEVDIRGVQDKIMKIEMRRFEAEAKNVSFNDITNAIQSENVTQPGGEILVGGMRRSVRIDGEFNSPEDMGDIIVKQEDGGNEVYLREVADVSFGDEDTTSYAREYGKTVVMLDVKKRAGENLLLAADQVKNIVGRRTGIPENVDISITNDQSNQTLDMVSNLENSIIFGILLVVGVLLFFLGLRNAVFVGVAIPLSMFMSFMLLNAAGVTLNVMVLFSLVLALGMLVDNGIVVVENIYRLMDEGMDRFEAAKKGVGEVAWPIIASTATTLAAFVPLALWPGMMGEFMKYLPITLMVVLGSSLFVALVINPVLTAMLMKVDEKEIDKRKSNIRIIILTLVGIFFAVAVSIPFGNIFLLVAFIMFTTRFIFTPGTRYFQNKLLPRLEEIYTQFLTYALKGKNPRKFLLGTFGMLIFSFILIGAFPPKVEFFPINEPNYVNIFVEHPIGTDIKVTNETAQQIETILDSTVLVWYDNKKEGDEKLIKSVISQVGNGTSDPMQGPSFGNTPHKARVTVAFAEYQYRKDEKGNTVATSDIMDTIRYALKNRFTADVRVIADKNENGPPQEPPVNIEVTGPGEYDETIERAEELRQFLVSKNVPGVEELRLNIETGKPELLVNIDRNKAIRFGLSTYQVASTIRTALFGSDVSTFKKGEDTYDINLRLDSDERNNIDALLDQKVNFMNNRGQKLSIPIRSVIKDYNLQSTYGSVARKNVRQMVTIYSKVNTNKANTNEVVAQMKEFAKEYENSDAGKSMKASGYNYKFTGQMEEQAKEMAFLSSALGVAVFLILLIIVSQFNSFSTPTIILSAVFLSLIGVFLGLLLSGMDFIIIMTMIGIISLAGVVVNNAIVLIDYTNLIRIRKRKELGLNEDQQLPMQTVIESIIEGGRTRLRPVLLTAITTVLGLVPLAAGININFVKIFTEYNPDFFVGGDNVMFFGPMSWTIIFGLTFATFLTLVIVPVMYLMLHRFKVKLFTRFNWKLRSNI